MRIIDWSSDVCSSDLQHDHICPAQIQLLHKAGPGDIAKNHRITLFTRTSDGIGVGVDRDKWLFMPPEHLRDHPSDTAKTDDNGAALAHLVIGNVDPVHRAAFDEFCGIAS